MEVKVAFQFSRDADEEVLCYSNSIYLPHCGTPYTGFIQALKRSLSQYARKHGYIAGALARLSEDEARAGTAALAALAFPNLSRLQRFSQQDIFGGLTVVISVRLSDPWYASAMKDRLTNPEVGDLVDHAAGEELSKFLNANPQAASAILAKVCQAADARMVAQKPR